MRRRLSYEHADGVPLQSSYSRNSKPELREFFHQTYLTFFVFLAILFIDMSAEAAPKIEVDAAPQSERRPKTSEEAEPSPGEIDVIREELTSAIRSAVERVKEARRQMKRIEKGVKDPEDASEVEMERDFLSHVIDKDEERIRTLRQELKEYEASGMIPILEQFSEVQTRAGSRQAKSKERTSKKEKTGEGEGIETAEDIPISEIGKRIEREREAGKVIVLEDERKNWQKEIKELEGLDRTEEQEKRMKELRGRVEKVALMAERAREMELLSRTEDRAAQIEREIRAARERYEEKRKKRREAESERADLRKGIEHEEDRLAALKAELNTDPTDEKREEAERIERHLEGVGREIRERNAIIRDFRQEEAAARSVFREADGLYKTFAAAILVSDKRIADLTSKIVKNEVPLEDEAPEEEERETQSESAAEPFSERDAVSFEKELRKPGRVKRAAKGAVAATPNVAAAAANTGVGGAAALTGAALAMSGRFLRTIGGNLGKLIRNPGRFFSEVGARFSSAMEDPPKGKGELIGFLSGVKWMLVGDPVPKKKE
jgi:hypothetical protein